MTSSIATTQLSSLTGVIERITFHSEESGYTIARLNTGNVKQLIAVVGSFANIQAGQTLQLQGIWIEHLQYGSQFQVVQYQETKPATLTGIEKYLGSGLIKGVGPVTAKLIVKHFGLDTLEIIENQIYRLSEVPGIAKKRITMISSTWEEQKSIKEVMIFLSGHGVFTTYAVKIYKQYGDSAISTVTTNPYQLAIDIFGIGFLTADRIAVNVEVSPWSKFRYRAGVLHVLDKASEDGHCYLPESKIVPFTKELLTTEEYKAKEEAIAAILKEMITEEQLIEAKTLHRLLEFDPSKMGFKRDLDNQLNCSAIVVDESSIVDLFMAHSLLKAIHKDCLLLMVGDIDQLPSVGPGNVLKDLIASEKIPVVRLTQVFRQAAESAIIRTAHQINHGQIPKLEPISMKATSDCLWHSGGTEAMAYKLFVN